MTGIAEAKNMYVVGAKILKTIVSYHEFNTEPNSMRIKQHTRSLENVASKDKASIYWMPALIPPAQSCL